MTRREWLALMACGTLAPSASGQMLHSTRILPGREPLGRLGLERAWFTAVPVRLGLERLIHISLAGGRVFAQTSEGQLHAFDAESGQFLWTADLGRGTNEAHDVAVNDTFAFASNASHLYCVDLGTGRPVWDQRLESFATTGAIATDKIVALGTRHGKVVAYSLVPAQDERFRKQEGPPGGFAFAWSTNGPVTSRPVVTDDVIAFGSTAGKLYVATLEKEEILHRSQPLGSIQGSLGTYGTGAESTLFVPSMNGNLYSINLFTGEHQWSYTAGAPIAAQPLVGTAPFTAPGDTAPAHHDTVFVLNDAGYLHSVHAESGESEWGPYGSHTAAQRILAVGNSRVYLRTEFGDLVVVDRGTGSVIASASASRERAGLDLRDYSLSVVNDVNDRIYLATSVGSLICLHELGQRVPNPVREPHEPAFGYIPPQGAGPRTPPPVPTPDQDAPADDEPNPFGN